MQTNWNERIFTQPTDEPVSIEEAEAHLRVSDTAEDTYIASLVSVARTQVEQWTNRALLTQQWDMWVEEPDLFNGAYRGINSLRIAANKIFIPRGPVASVDLIESLDEDNVATTIDPSTYVVDTVMEPASIRFKVTPPAGKLHVRYTAGEESADNVPMPLKQAILLLVGSYYDNRLDEVVAANTLTSIRMMNGVESLIANHRLFPFGVNIAC